MLVERAGFGLCGLGPHGGQKKAWGPKKGKTKEPFYQKNHDLGRLSSFPEHMFVLGSFFGKLIGFIVPEMVPWLSKKSKDQPGGPRTNLEVFGDEVSFQKT